MSGLLLLGVLGLWGWGCWWLARRLCRPIERRYFRAAARYLTFACLLPLPLADEVYSRLEFTRLCRANAELVVHNPQLAGKTVWYAGGPSRHLKIGLLSGLERQWNYVMPETEAPAFHYTDFQVQGGWFIKALGISETQAPLLFDGRCGPADALDLRAKLHVTVVDKPR